MLTGSHARGLATAYSDLDVYVIVDQRGGQWTRTRRTPALDEVVCTVAELADTSDRWQRYAYRGAQVLLDRLGGRITELVEAQATLTTAEAHEWARDGLGGYLNLIYRAAKSRRDGRGLEARLDEMESVSWLLTALFAMHGRVRPYNKYLRWELETYPLGDPWDASTLPERLASAPAALFADLERLASERGHADIVESWGGELTLLRQPGR